MARRVETSNRPVGATRLTAASWLSFLFAAGAGLWFTLTTSYQIPNWETEFYIPLEAFVVIGLMIFQFIAILAAFMAGRADWRRSASIKVWNIIFIVAAISLATFEVLHGLIVDPERKGHSPWLPAFLSFVGGSAIAALALFAERPRRAALADEEGTASVEEQELLDELAARRPRRAA